MNKTNNSRDIKMIVVDLDGTLLRSDKTISEFTQQTLEECRKKGIIVTIATARPIRAVDAYLDIIKPTACIYHNGAISFHFDELVDLFLVESNVANTIIQNIKSCFPDIKIAFEMQEKLYSNFDTSLIWDGAECTITDLAQPPKYEVEKVIVYIEDNHEFLQNIDKFIPDDIYVDVAENQIAFFMHKNASKHYSLSKMINKLNVPVENIVSFGDDIPDIGMIKFCGIGVAMENAKDLVKAQADVICQSNDDDGVANWINQNILK